MFFKAESPKSSTASPEELKELTEVPDESDSGLSMVKLSCMADCATRLVVAACMRELVWGGVCDSALGKEGESGRVKLPTLSCFPPTCQCTTDHAKVEEGSNGAKRTEQHHGERGGNFLCPWISVPVSTDHLTERRRVRASPNEWVDLAHESRRHEEGPARKNCIVIDLSCGAACRALERRAVSRQSTQRMVP